jgi:hypothetical protein
MFAFRSGRTNRGAGAGTLSRHSIYSKVENLVLRAKSEEIDFAVKPV